MIEKGGVEKSSNSEIIRVVPPQEFRFYDKWLIEFKTRLDTLYKNKVPRLLIQDSQYPDRSPRTRILPLNNNLRNNTSQSSRLALVPFWNIAMAGYSNRETMFFPLETLDGLLGSDPKLVEETILLCPYSGGRSDHASRTKDDVLMQGETIYARLFAKLLKAVGATDIVTLDIHSFEASQYFTEIGIKHLNLTALPILVKEFLEKNANQHKLFDPKEWLILALDHGSLQRNLLMGKLLNIPNEQIIICKKNRNHLGDLEMQIEHSKLSPEAMAGFKLITADDLGDTLGSINLLRRLTTGLNSRELHILLSHGVLSYPAAERLEEMDYNQPTIQIITSDSLPTARYDFENQARLTVASGKTADLFADFIPPILEFGLETLVENPDILQRTNYEALIPYIFPPRNKEEVFAEFIQRNN